MVFRNKAWGGHLPAVVWIEKLKTSNRCRKRRPDSVRIRSLHVSPDLPFKGNMQIGGWWTCRKQPAQVLLFTNRQSANPTGRYIDGSGVLAYPITMYYGVGSSWQRQICGLGG